MSKLTDVAKRCVFDGNGDALVDLLSEIEDMDVSECDLSEYNRFAMDDRERLALFGLRCHILAANIRYLKDHPEWDGEGSVLE